MPVDHHKNIIEVENISVSFGKQKVLQNINLSVHVGDYLGIIGPNGGGKTTLLKIILGLIPADTGTVKLFGQLLSEFHDWWKIGYVAQKLASLDSSFPLTTREIVGMGLYGKKGIGHRLNQNDNEAVDLALKAVDMLDFADRLLNTLSQGQQQRVFIARSLVSHPQILFLDEPTVGVDVATQEQFYLLLKKLNREMEITLVFISHDIDVIAHEATEFACINQQLVYHGPPKAFLQSEYLTKLYGKGIQFIVHGH